MQPGIAVGVPVRITASGSKSISTIPGALVGISMGSASTGAEVTLWAAASGSGTPSAIMNLAPTVTGPTLYVAMDCPSGLTARVTGVNPEITYYYAVMAGGA